MSLIEDRSLVQSRLTYRAVGSSTGIKEFLGVNNTVANVSDPFQHIPHTDFGSGDVPIPTEDYLALKEANNGADKFMVHLPFAISSVSFFHGLPGIPSADTSPDGLKLSPCTLARIFNGKISQWDDPEIIETNPKLISTLQSSWGKPENGYNIFVARRVKGSSSTDSITRYFHDTCPTEWPLDNVGTTVENWHVRTHPCEGSALMTACIKDNPGSIGYIDSGHGWAERLNEVAIENKDKKYLTSTISVENDGLMSAIESTILPSTMTEDWGPINFINAEGEHTWPITLMSYIYVRTDISRYMEDPFERGLLKIFLESLFTENYFSNCRLLGFSPLPPALNVKVKQSIENDILWEFPITNPEFVGGKNAWTFEVDTNPIGGTGPFVISNKRQSYNGVGIDEISGETKQLKEEVRFAYDAISALLSQENADFNKLASKNTADAALVLAALSFTLWCCVIVGYLVNMYLFGKPAPYNEASQA
jgi:ABC-type phosphate transport system substrate-binding protein